LTNPYILVGGFILLCCVLNNHTQDSEHAQLERAQLRKLEAEGYGDFPPEEDTYD